MGNAADRAIAIVAVGAILPDAPNVAAFWENIKKGRYCISDTPVERWDPALYYDPDPAAPDKTYSKIGGWVREYAWEPMKWHLPVPPCVSAAMDPSQQWAINCTRQVLDDYGYPKRAFDLERTAIILGNAMGGERHYRTVLRTLFPELALDLEAAASFSSLPEPVRKKILDEFHSRLDHRLPPITEDTMPGELSNCIAGRIANLFNFRGTNFTADAACASALAAINAAINGLAAHDFEVAITGGIDRNMGASTFVKFCKIGALSATGSRPYADGADGFVMGEGAAMFMMKRLADAERDGDKVYAVLRGVGGSSDGKGKGITAPNPVGQRLAMQRGWENADLSPATATLIEGHGTSTRVGDVVEVQSMFDVLGGFNLPVHSIALGSIKSNIGHLKSAAGAAGLLKATLAVHEKVLPPSVQCEHTNPGIDFSHSPLYVNTELKPWDVPKGTVRRAGVSAFGFGGTNFHVVLEEHIPGSIPGNGKRSIAVSATTPQVRGGEMSATTVSSGSASAMECGYKAPLRGALVIGGNSDAELAQRLRIVLADAENGHAQMPTAPAASDLRAPERLAIDYADARDLADKAGKARKALEANQPAIWKALRAQGIFRGHGPAPKVAFLYTGQGSQYINMLRPLRDSEPVVAQVFAEADRVMAPLLGKPLTDFIYINADDPAAVARAEEDLRQTAITQPAVLATDAALTALLAQYGIRPDMAMGHSLGEYGALVAAGALPFGDALEAVSARGREMTRVAMSDNGRMAAVFAPPSEIERILKTIDGYVVIANLNSEHQCVIGGASKAVEQAMEALLKAAYEVSPLNVSHAFHTSIVAPASEPLRRTLERLRLQSPALPVVANVDGEFYPMGAGVVPQMLDILAKQVASPVQFIKGLRTLYNAGVRVFVETGPKKALHGFAEDVLGGDNDVLALFTNHPKFGDVVSFNQALCGLYSAGLGAAKPEITRETQAPVSTAPLGEVREVEPSISAGPSGPRATAGWSNDRYLALGRAFADTLERLFADYPGGSAAPAEPVVITGAALGLPGTEHIFDDGNVARILRGEQFIDAIPTRFRRAMLDKHITRLVKSDSGGPTFETINNVADVIKLAGRGGAFDLGHEFGVPAERLAALDRVTRLAIAAGIDALRDAGIPLVMRYKKTSKGTQLPDRWMLPDALRDDTGVIFASAFPGCDSYADEMSRYFQDLACREQISMLESLLARAAQANGQSVLGQEIQRRVDELRAALDKQPYVFDRRFLFKVLAMGHSQFAEFIGARGPNPQLNAACASTTQAVGLAEQWIRSGHCRRVIVISADDITSDHLLDWFGAGFLASGAAATDDVVEEAAIPFDRRRHGMIIGMGAAALVLESAAAARQRGLRPICEVLAAVTANSAFHGTRLDVEHIGQVMESLLVQAETRCGIARHQIAPHTMFMSHETYTPARGGSAAAEIHALRHVFGHAADSIVIANTKGFTGHAMAAGIEDVVAIKALETGCVPPVPNFKEVDPELGTLNLSRGGLYPVNYALRLGAGFGSQISMTLLRGIASQDGRRPAPSDLGYSYRIADANAWKDWVNQISGAPAAELEMVHRTLRVRDRGVSTRIAQTSASVQVAAPPAPKPETPAPPPVIVPAVPAAEVKPTVPASIAPVVSAPPVSADEVKDRILALVAEKTGYPVDMLDLDLDLEADLGIDTVKQAEVFAAIRETYGIVRDDTIKLRDFPTLAHVIRFVHQRRPDLAAQPAIPDKPAVVAAPQPAPEPSAQIVVQPAAPAAQPVTDSVRESIVALVVEKTGYPADMLDLDLDLEADLGVDTVKQAELFAAVRELYNIPRDTNLKLRDFPTLAHVIRFVYEKRPDLAATQGPPRMTPTPPVAAVPVAPEVPHTSPVPSATDDEIKDKVLDIVAAKTGYPKDMLDLDLDLEADLGIDTVKQAEMFAAIREAYNIPRDADLKLRDFPTLAHVIVFARERRAVPTAAADPVQAQPRAAEQVAPQTVAAPRPAVLSFEATEKVPRRVPTPVLRPPLDICKPTGVALGAGKRVIIMPDTSGVATLLAEKLLQQGTEVLSIPSPCTPEILENCLKTWTAAGPVDGVYWLPALDAEKNVAEMTTADWRQAVHTRLKLMYAGMRSLYQQIAWPGTFLVSAMRLGGMHGYDSAGATAPLGGAVTGFAKTYKRERIDALVKAVDFTTSANPREIADLLIAETLRDPGAVEIGYQGGRRWSIGLREQPSADGQPGITFDRNTVFLVTGAAGSIVSAITADLAAASGGTFYLLDLVPKPDPNNSDLTRFATDKEGLKRDLFTRMQARGERATPALIEKELAALERAQAAQAAIDAVGAAGGTAHYFSVNLTDPDAVAKVIAEVRQRSGHVDVLLHAAGMERSHLLPDKEAREFDLVFDVKADGFFNLLHAIADMPLGATVVFSSVAGRFGNPGQADYSSANDLLCKISSSFRTTRPATRGIAIDWTAWAGMGMATRGSIPKMMEVAGIDMLPPEAGIPLIRRELTVGGTRGEIVIAQRLGILLNEWDATGGLDSTASAAFVQPGPILAKAVSMQLYRGLTVETTLDPKLQPFLHDHQIDGTPVLPGVMGIEAFAEAALALLPGWHIACIEDVNFLAPFKFYRNEARTVTVEAAIYGDGDSAFADCHLIGLRSLPTQREPQATTHFTARVRLSKGAVEITKGSVPQPAGAVIEAAEIYRVYFHGPAYQVVERAWRSGTRTLGLLSSALPSNHLPPELPLAAAPRLIELCFQTAGLWEIAEQGRFGLPQHVDRISFVPTAAAAHGPIYAVVTSRPEQGTFDAEVVDATGTLCVQLSGYRTVALPVGASDEKLRAFRAVA